METIAGTLGELRSRYEDADEGDSPVVLFGAGQCGRLTADWMWSVDCRPLVFCDNDSRLWGKVVNGVEVLSPAQAAKRYPGAVFVVCVRDTESAELMRRHLDILGVRHADNCSWMVCPPLDADVLGSVWADEESRVECLAQLRYRVGFLVPRPHLSHDEMYFPHGLFRLHDHEVFIDGGAFDGDTLLEFRQRGGLLEYHGFEPDFTNFLRLAKYVTEHPGNFVGYTWRAALSNENSMIRFRSTSNVSSRVDAAGDVMVPCFTVDHIRTQHPPTFVKLDIEGSELKALQGAEQTIRKHRPILAVCLYHKPQDLWEIPLWIHGLDVGYRIYLRRHGPADTELVCYAVPEERLNLLGDLQGRG